MSLNRSKRLGVSILFTVVALVTGCQSLKPVDAEKSTSNKPEVIGIDQLQALSKQADELYQSRDFDRAGAIYSEILIQDPKNLQANYRLGNIAFRQQNWAQARTHYSAVIEIEPRHARAQYNLAMTYLTLAERHLKFYAATAGADANLSAVAKLVMALDDITQARSGSSSTADAEKKPATGSALDQLIDELAR